MAVQQTVLFTFQDASGNPLANGSVQIRLSRDASQGVLGGSSIMAGRTTVVALDAYGAAIINLWPNDAIYPLGSVYFITAFTALGQPAWNGQITVTSAPPPPPSAISATFSHATFNTDWAWVIGAFKSASGTPVFLASIEAIGATYGGTNSTTGGYSGYGAGASSINTSGASIFIAVLHTNGGTPTVSDSASNVWSYGSTYVTSGSACVMRLAYCVAPITSATHTFTPSSVGGNAEQSCEVFVFSGGIGWTLDVEAGSTAAQTPILPNDDITTGTITPTEIGEIFVAGFGSNGSVSTAIANNGFTGGISGQVVGICLPQYLNGTPEVGISAYLIQ